MLEKLSTHDVQDVFDLFSVMDKCTRAANGHAWHSQPVLEAGKVAKPIADAAAQGSGKKKKKMAIGKDKPLADAPIVAAAAGGGLGPRSNKHPHLPSSSDEGG
jgi:hypothetical protein